MAKKVIDEKDEANAKLLDDFADLIHSLAKLYDVSYVLVGFRGNSNIAAGNACMVCSAGIIVDFCEDNNIRCIGDKSNEGNGKKEKVH